MAVVFIVHLNVIVPEIIVSICEGALQNVSKISMYRKITSEFRVEYKISK